MAPYFKYTAKNKNGDEIEKVVKSENPIAIAKKAKNKGYHIIKIKKTTTMENNKNKKNSLLIRQKSIDKADLFLFTEQFAIMIGSGLSIIESLLILEDQIKNKMFKKSIKKIGENIEKGSSLSEAIKLEKNIFPYFYQQMIKIGEMAGVLPKILKDLSLYYKWQIEIRKKVLSSLYYPMLLLAATFLTIILLLTYVIPSFEEIFFFFFTILFYPTIVILFISKNLKEEGMFLHFNGKYHSQFHEGVVWYLKKYVPEIKIVTITTVLMDEVQKPKKEILEEADFVIVVDDDITGSY